MGAGPGDDDVGPPGQRVVEVPQTGLQAGRVTDRQRDPATGLGIILNITITAYTCQERFNVR